MADSTEDWNTTASLLRSVLGHVERRQRLAQSSQPSQAIPSAGSLGHGAVQQTSNNSSPSNAAVVPAIQQSSSSRPRLEFEKLFGYKPDVSSGRKKKRKSSNRQSRSPVPKCSKVKLWRKETICLRFKDQSKGPDTAEKMQLATVGLGLKELSFNAEGNSKHIHNVLLDAFTAPNDCGGYTLHRLSSNSTDLITIEPPRGGVTVRYLKDIVKSAKLFVRPLQADIHVDCIRDGSDDEVCIHFYF